MNNIVTKLRNLPVFIKSWWGSGELGGWYNLNPLDGTGFQRNLVVGPTSSCGAVYACVNVCAQALATMPMKHYRELPSGGREVITTSALSRIFRNPNSYQTFSDFILNLVFNLLYYGNVYCYAIRNNRSEVESLHILSARNTVPYIDQETFSVFYAVGDNPLVDAPLNYLIPARDILHIRLYTPQHPLVGVSPIKYSALAVSINMSIGGSQSSFFSNMSRPSGILSTDHTMTAAQMKDLREAFEEKAKGMNSGGIPILGWGIKWQPMTISSEDAQLIEAYRMSIEDIARVFRVPLALIGDYSKATYANTEQLISSWLSTGLGFLMEHIESSFGKFFRLPYDESTDFDVSVLLRTDFGARIEGLTKAISGGLMSPNEARARENLPAVEAGEEPRVQAQVVPLSQVNTIQSAPAAPAAPAAPVEQDQQDESTKLSEPPLELTEDERQFAVWAVERAIKKAMAA